MFICRFIHEQRNDLSRSQTLFFIGIFKMLASSCSSNSYIRNPSSHSVKIKTQTFGEFIDDKDVDSRDRTILGSD